MIKREEGFTLIELLITMVVVVFFLAAASQVFIGLLTQFKQQSKIAETNIEGIVGLEILRQDIEGAGYGLPWDGLITYNESSSNPFSLNDATTGVPRAITSQNSATFAGPNSIFDNSDYLVIKGVNVARNSPSEKWTTLSSVSPYVRTWAPATEKLDYPPGANPYVIVLSPGGATAQRVLVVDGTAFSVTYSGVTSTPWRPTDPTETRLVYGIDPDYDPRMPFNRSDYFLQKFDTSGNDITPKRCAVNTGVLVKATVSHSDGSFSSFPLLDCVADMQVVYALDNNEDGSFDPSNPALPLDGYSDDITTAPLTAEQIRTRIKQVRVYILGHEGQRDGNYTYPNNTITVGEFGLGRNFDLTTITNYQNYRWKLYTIVTKPNNLE